MNEGEPQPQPMELTHDYPYYYRGYHEGGGVCGVRIYQQDGQPPVIIASELPENTNTSVTNMAEYLAAEIVARHFPERFDEEQPAVWVEHYERTRQELRQGMPEYSLVEFDSWTPKKYNMGGWRTKIGKPSWKHISKEDLEGIIGQPVDKPRQEEGGRPLTY